MSASHSERASNIRWRRRFAGAIVFLVLTALLVGRCWLRGHSSELHLDVGLNHLSQAIIARHHGDADGAAGHFEASRGEFSSSAGNGLGASTSVLALELADILENDNLARAEPPLRPTLEALRDADFILARRRFTTLRDQSVGSSEARRRALSTLGDLLQRLVEHSRAD